MTLKQLDKARVLDNKYIISVDDHKTAYYNGPAKIVLTTALFGWLKSFAAHIRKYVADADKVPEVFVSWNGDSLSSGQVTRCVQSIWKKAGNNGDITFNLVRKTAVSNIHQNHPHLKDSLADLMSHSVSTATKCYRVVEKERTSVAASTQLSESLRRLDSVADICVSQPVSQNCPSSEGSINDAQIHKKTDVNELNVVNEGSCDPNVSGECTEAQPSEMPDIVAASCQSYRRDIFSETDTAIIRKSCGKIIASGPISQSLVTQALEVNSEGQDLLGRFGIIQLVSRVKYERRKMRGKQLFGACRALKISM